MKLDEILLKILTDKTVTDIHLRENLSPWVRKETGDGFDNEIEPINPSDFVDWVRSSIDDNYLTTLRKKVVHMILL